MKTTRHLHHRRGCLSHRSGGGRGTVKPAAARPRPTRFRRILVPVDFSAGSDLALRHAAALARAHVARVLPVHVARPICFAVDCGYGPVERALPDRACLRRTRSRLGRMVRRFLPAALAEEVAVRSGEPVEELARAATEWNADLIVVLAHDVLGRASTAPTHTLDRLVREVRCPVLVLHGPRHAREPGSTRY